MAAQTDTATNVFDQVFDNLRKTAESNLELQQEFFRQWVRTGPVFPNKKMPGWNAC